MAQSNSHVVRDAAAATHPDTTFAVGSVRKFVSRMMA